MCLALPGKIIKTYFDGNLLMGEVDFSGVQKMVCLAYTPDAKNGDFVVVHVGFAISVLNEHYAKETLKIAQEAADEIRG